MTITSALLQEYFSGQRRRAIYAESVRQFHHLRVHALGETPHHLISERRPNESEDIHRYRMRIWEPVTRQAFNRVVQSLSKIRRSPDWMIKYDPQARHARIKPSDTLEQYCEFNFPNHGSLTHWVFASWLPAVSMDANSLLLIMPTRLPSHESQYVQPIPVIYHADQVLEYTPGELAILRADTPHTVTQHGATYHYDQYYVVTPAHIALYRSEGEGYYPVQEQLIHHGLGYLPVVAARGQYVRQVQGVPLYESRLAPMMPSMNEAVREYSDLQAAVVNHLFPERWEMASQDCSHCQGAGRVNTNHGQEGKPKYIVCPACRGLGMQGHSGPYRKMVIRPAKTNLGEQPMPIPPFDYVKKDVEVVKVMEERIERHIYRALSAVNMQFLAQTPLNISGDAKALDRDELNNFVYNVAEDLVATMDQLYAVIADYRYKLLYPDPADRRAMLPIIAVPQVYDLLNASYYVDELAKAKSSGMNGMVLTAMEYEFAARRFAAQPDICSRLRAALELDPLPGLTEQDKMTRLSNGGISRIDYVVSCNISPFVTRATEADTGFIALPYAAAIAILRGYAQELIDQEARTHIAHQ
jgi:hypothetical protein